MRKHESGFTLIELMIVIAIIAIIAAIAIPNLLAAKLSANETAAIATLRNLTSAQAMVQGGGKIDCDADGIGEFGCFVEMTGTKAPRKGPATGTPPACDWTNQATSKINPSVLSAALAGVDAQGFVTKSGYAFTIFLPTNAVPSGFVHETGDPPAQTNASFATPIACDIAETTWCAYAIPVARGNSGNRAFFVNQAGDVMQSPNDIAPHQGVAAGAILGSAAFKGTAGITSQIAVGTAGIDTNLWKVTN